MIYREWMERAQRRYFRHLAKRTKSIPELCKIAGISQSLAYRLMRELKLRKARETLPAPQGQCRMAITRGMRQTT